MILRTNFSVLLSKLGYFPNPLIKGIQNVNLKISYFLKIPHTETKHLSTDADSSTNTTVGWTKNTQKPDFFEKRKKSSKTQKLKNV